MPRLCCTLDRQKVSSVEGIENIGYREKERWEARAKQAAEQQASSADVPVARGMSHPISHTASTTGVDAPSVSSGCNLLSSRTVPCATESSAPPESCETTNRHGLPSISAVKGHCEGEEVTLEKTASSVTAASVAAAAAACGASATSAVAAASGRPRHVLCEEAIPLALANAGLPNLKTQVWVENLQSCASCSLTS